MPILRTLSFVYILISAFCAIAPEASAQSSDDEALARQLFETGRGYFERAQYERAAEAFGEAYRLSGRPQLLVNQARALESMGQNAEAVELLDRALRELPEDSPLRPQVEQRRTRLAAQAERDRAAAEAAAATEPEEPDEAPESTPTEEIEAPGRGVMWWSGVSAIGLGGASLVVALGTGLASNNLQKELDDACPGDVCPPEREADVDRGNALSATSTAMLIVGLAASATGLVLMLLPGSDEESAPESGDVEVTAGPGQIGAGMRLTF